MPTYSLKNLVLYFLKLGYAGFGGPVALVGYMHRDLVEDKKWIAEADYKEGMALAQLSPGPMAAQLGIYLGYVHCNNSSLFYTNKYFFIQEGTIF
jgi:chromate transporter